MAGKAYMTVLIQSHFGDHHVHAVSWGIRQLGGEAVRFVISDFPGELGLSIQFDGESPPILSSIEPTLDAAIRSATTIWNRRQGRFTQIPTLADNDRAFVIQQSRVFRDAFRHLLRPDAFWVNQPRQAAQAELKPLQLQAAQKAGLKVPRTLISNEPEEIRAFVQSCSRAIFKSLFFATWSGNRGRHNHRAITYTAPVLKRDLEQDGALQAAPGIYQEYVHKDVEIRAMCFGKSVLAIQIQARKSRGPESIDWRIDQKNMKFCNFELPVYIKNMLFDVMERLGIVFGCFDLIRTPEGEYVFIEVNQMGQFLWMEQGESSHRFLHAMCEFLISGETDFKFKAPRMAISLERYLASDTYSADKAVFNSGKARRQEQQPHVELSFDREHRP